MRDIFIEARRDVVLPLTEKEVQRLSRVRVSITRGIVPIGEEAQELQVLMIREFLTRTRAVIT